MTLKPLKERASYRNSDSPAVSGVFIPWRLSKNGSLQDTTKAFSMDKRMHKIPTRQLLKGEGSVLLNMVLF
jgi:hypothetical protein